MIFETIIYLSFFVLGFSFTKIDNYVLTNFSGTNYTFAIVDNTGSQGYIGLVQNEIKKINRYQIISSQAILLGQYIIQNTQPDNIMFYKSYLIVYSNKNPNLTVFNIANYSQQYTFSIQNIFFQKMTYLNNRNIVLFSSIQGDFGYIIDFLSGNNINFIAKGSFGQVTYKSSPDQNFLVFLQGYKTDVLIYQLSNFTLIVNFTLNLTYQAEYYRTCWDSTSLKFYIIPKQQGRIFIIDINNGSFFIQNQIFSQYDYQVNETSNLTNLTSNTSQNFSNSSNITNITNSLNTNQSYTFYIKNQEMFLSKSILNIIQVSYSLNQNCLIIAAYFQTLKRVIIFTFDPTTSLILNYQKFNYFQNPLIGLRFDQQKDLYFVIWTSQAILFYELVVMIKGGGGGSGGGSGSGGGNGGGSGSSNGTINQNSTNSTFNRNSTNSTFNQNSINSTFNQNSTNLTLNALNPQNGISNLQLQIYQTFLFEVRYIYKKLHMIPGCRTILKPFFSFFANFDDIWLYIYHLRYYNRVVTSIFTITRDIQVQKWTILPYKTLWAYIGITASAFQEKFSNKLNYTNWKFFQIEGSTSGFIYNTSDFFLSNVILVLFIYLAFKLLFLILFTRKISLLFRPFFFWITYFIMVTDGNVHYMTYLFGFEMIHFFNFNFIDKISSIIVIFIFFALFMFIGCSSYLIRDYYKKLSKYMFDNVKTTFKGAFYLTAQFGCRNIILGLLHSFVNAHNYIQQIWILIIFEVIFFSISLVLFFRQDPYILKFKIWILLTTTFVRILMIFTFTIDHKENSIFYFYEKIHIVLVYVYFLLLGISIIYEILNTLIEIYHIICSVEKTQQISAQKNILQNAQIMLTSESMSPLNLNIKAASFKNQLFQNQIKQSSIIKQAISKEKKQTYIQSPEALIAFNKQKKTTILPFRNLKKIKITNPFENKKINRQSLKINHLKPAKDNQNIIQNQNQAKVKMSFYQYPQKHIKKFVQIKQNIKHVQNLHLDQRITNLLDQHKKLKKRLFHK